MTARAAIGIVLAAMFTPGAHADDAALAREAASLKTVCTKCHNLEMVTDTPRSLEEWQETVQQMVDRGAKGTDAQFDDILDLLHRTYTTINVNSAEAGELSIVLSVPDDVASRIVARRAAQPFAGLADLKSVPGIDAAALDAKSKLVFFK